MHSFVLGTGGNGEAELPTQSDLQSVPNAGLDVVCSDHQRHPVWLQALLQVRGTHPFLNSARGEVGIRRRATLPSRTIELVVWNISSFC